MPEVGFTSTGLYALESALLAAGERGENAYPVLDVIAGRMLRHEKQVFLTSGASVGRPWKALDDDTVIRRKGGALPLIASGKLMRSLTERGAEGSILEVTDSYIRFGTSLDYATFHDTGTKHMPRRQPIMFTTREANDYYRTMLDFIVNGNLPAR